VGLTVGVDVGGTKIAAGVVDDAGAILVEETEPTPAADPNALASAISDLVTRLRRSYQVEAVGIGAAGFVDAKRSSVLFAPNINWTDEPLAADVGSQVGLPVVVENDANAAAWAEFQFGAGKDVDDLLMIAVGTGIGGGYVTENRLYRGAFGVAGEVGHMRVIPGGIKCGCGRYGCWEQYASGRSLVREAKDRIATELPEAAALAALAGPDGDGLTGQMVTAEATAGDPLSRELLADVGRWLGAGIATLVAVLDPAVVVVGGGVGEAGDLVMLPARRSFARTLPAATHRPHPELRVTSLGNRAGMIGAADLARTP
jgi:glucokinase